MIPSAVQREADEAEKLMQELEAEATEGTTGETPAEGTTPDDGAPKGDDTAPDATPKDDTPADTGEIEQLKAQLAELRQDLSITSGRLRAVADENKALKAENAELKAKPPQPTEEELKLKEKIESFRDDYPDVAEQLEIRDREIAELKATIRELRAGMVSQPSQQAGPDPFIRGLTDEVGNWREIKDDPGFATYLAESDPETGLTRYELADMHQQKRNAAGVARFYKGYLSSKTGGSTPAATKTAPDKQKELEKRLAPDRGASGGPSEARKDTTIYPRATVDKFYTDWRRGLYRGKEAEAESLDRLYTDAATEGRIRT